MNFLIISHFFAPYAHVGAKRMTALAAYLNQRNENVYVLKANDLEYGSETVKNATLTEGVNVISLPNAHSNAVIRKIARKRQYWKAVKALLKSTPIDVVIISGGPFNYFGVIPKIKCAWPNIKCVLDFRDLLDGTQCSGDSTSFLQKIGFRVDLATEKKAVSCADLCLTVSEQMNRTYQRRYPCYSSKFINIQNGFDNVTLSQETQDKIANYADFKHRESEPLRFGIFGKYGFYDSKYYDMLANCVQKMKEEGTQIHIVQYGVNETALRESFESRGLSAHYVFEPTVCYEQDLLKLQTCDAVIATNFLKEALGTKIFDYIWINRPIITINPHPDGEQITLTKKFQNGFPCCDGDALEDVFEAITNLKQLELDPNEEKRMEFGRRHQFDKLYMRLDEEMRRRA